jgi:hypothetical protein
MQSHLNAYCVVPATISSGFVVVAHNLLEGIDSGRVFNDFDSLRLEHPPTEGDGVLEDLT